MLFKKSILITSLVFSSAAFAQNDYTGTYKDSQTGSELLLEKNKNAYKFSLLAASGQNSGGAAGQVEFKQQQASFTDKEYGDCTLNFSYIDAAESSKANSAIEIEQKGSSADCGFGLNVFADGNYQFIEKKVNFSEHSLEN